MDIKSMTIEQLKALAFDEVKRQAQAQRNLQILEARMQELELEKQKVQEVADA